VDPRNQTLSPSYEFRDELSTTAANMSGSFGFSLDYNPSSFLCTQPSLSPELQNSCDQTAHRRKQDAQILYWNFILCVITYDISFDTTLYRIVSYNHMLICIQLISQA
jgi:hypothetical protein